MTSFNINQSSKMPQITEAQNMMNNGGGGNTGYLESGRKKKKKKEDEINPAILKEEGEDKFEHTEVEYEDDDDYYGTSSLADIEQKANETEKEEPAKIKNKFFDLMENIGKIVKPVEQNSTQNFPSSDFLTLSKNKYS